MRFPEKGEARAAAEALDARLRAVAGDDIRAAEVNVCSGEMRGDGTAILGVYGDLLDVADVAEFAEPVVHSFIRDIAGGVMPDVAMRSMFLLAVAQGVLMERARWAQ